MGGRWSPAEGSAPPPIRRRRTPAPAPSGQGPSSLGSADQSAPILTRVPSPHRQKREARAPVRPLEQGQRLHGGGRSGDCRGWALTGRPPAAPGPPPRADWPERLSIAGRCRPPAPSPG